ERSRGTVEVEILASNEQIARSRLKKLLARAKRAGLEFEASFGPMYAREDDRKGEQVYRMIEIIGDAPVIDGWRFRGVIDWSAGDMPLCHGTTDVEIYRNAEKRCDHCNTRRLKTLGIVIRKEDQTM